MLAWWLEGNPGEELEEDGIKLSLALAPLLPLPPPGAYTRHSSEELRSASCKLHSRENVPLEGVVLPDHAIVVVLHSHPEIKNYFRL